MRFFTPAFAHDSNISHLNLLYSYAEAFSNIVSISWRNIIHVAKIFVESKQLQ